MAFLIIKKIMKKKSTTAHIFPPIPSLGKQLQNIFELFSLVSASELLILSKSRMTSSISDVESSKVPLLIPNDDSEHPFSNLSK